MRLLRLYQLRLGLWLCRSAIERLNRALGVVRYAYSVPWRLIGERVRVTIAGGVLRIHHAGREVAVHPRQVGRRQRLVDPAHFEGVAGFRAKIIRTANRSTAAEEEPAPALLRPLAEYEALIGGGF
jgi:hypothetical protein